jgi:hypothetical protein
MTFQTVHTPPGSPRLPTQTAAPTASAEQSSAALGKGVTELRQYYQLEETTDAPFLSELERRILKGEKPTDISLLDRACALGDWKRATSLLPEIGLDRWIPKIDASFKEACEIGDLNTARALIDIVVESPATGQILVEWDKFVIHHHHDKLQEPISSALCILYGWPSSSAK